MYLLSLVSTGVPISGGFFSIFLITEIQNNPHQLLSSILFLVLVQITLLYNINIEIYIHNINVFLVFVCVVISCLCHNAKAKLKCSDSIHNVLFYHWSHNMMLIPTIGHII